MYAIEALVGRNLAVDAALLGERSVALLCGVELVPLTEPVVELVRANAGPGQSLPGSDDLRVPTSTEMAWLMANLGYRHPCAYVLAEYFGGGGEQFAAAWFGATPLMLPAATTTSPGGSLPSPPLLGQAINVALRAIGIDRGDAIDEFDAVGLGRFRRTAAWVDPPPSG